MTEILFDENGVVSLGAISSQENVVPKARILINPPPKDGAAVCGRHISELKPFCGPGDPLVGDFSGELLVKRWRRDCPYDEEAEKAWEEAGKEVRKETRKEMLDDEDLLPRFISKYGKKKGQKYYWWSHVYGSIGASWECRDCIVLDEYKYFEKRREKCLPSRKIR
jgi:hypothetical protein